MCGGGGGGGGGEERDKKTVNHSSTPTGGDDDYPYIEQNVNKKLNDYHDENSVNDQKNNKANGVAYKTSSSSKLNTQKDISNRKGKSINTKETLVPCTICPVIINCLS